ncbi:MAG: C4-dicarboxylate ABC transporter [Geminicoccaceae bacterium]|nr:MAG: C4-dicarboxylate ABC transporter [Geminicoccaceae bacterium]
MGRWSKTGALALALAVGWSGAVRADTVTLRLHHFLPPQATIPANAITPWIQAIEAASDGRLRIEHYPAMQLGGAPPSLYDQARDGVVDIAWTLLGYTPGRFPRAEAFELPFLGTTGEATSRAFSAFVEAHAMADFDGVRPLVVHTHGPGLLHVRGSGVERLEDLQGLTLRGPTRVTTQLLSTLGANAIGMPVPAVPEALARGVIDGVAVPWEVTPSLRIAELVDTHTEFTGIHGLYTATFVLAMNQGSYDRLPDDLRAIIDAHSGIERAAAFGRAMDVNDVVGRDIALAAGNRVVVLDAAETARWQEAAAAVVESWIAEAEARGIEGGALVEAARALVAEHTARSTE